jgi:CO dehydrogenase/acetyl-CoA synthase alpha subunit
LGLSISQAIRVAMRFLFAVPLLILAVDGVRNDHHINENMLATGICTFCVDATNFQHDFRSFGSLAAFGVAISSGITLVVGVTAMTGNDRVVLKFSCRYFSPGLLKAKLLHEMKQKRKSAVDEE